MFNHLYQTESSQTALAAWEEKDKEREERERMAAEETVKVQAEEDRVEWLRAETEAKVKPSTQKLF
jgi:uncharacterized protein HemX